MTTVGSGHRRCKSQIVTSLSNQNQSNGFQRLKTQMQKALNWGGNQDQAFFNPEILANQKRQWYQFHTKSSVGTEVYLKSIVNSMEIVAKARVRSLDPDEVVGGEEIGPEWCEAHVLVAIKRRERLVRPYGMFITIEDALGATVAWPCPFVSVVPEDET